MKKRVISIVLTMCMVIALMPTTIQASIRNNGVKLQEGWYYLRCMNNYLNLDANGNAELRDKTNTTEGNAKFYARFDGELILETADGRYLGLDTQQIKNGLRVKAVENLSGNMIRWDIYNEDKPSKDIWSLRPRMKIDYLLNASAQKNDDGTQIIIWEHIDKWRCASSPVPDSPNHGEFRFIPTSAPVGATVPGTPKAPANGWYSLRFDSDSVNNIIDVIKTDLVELNSWSCAMTWTRAFYVENKGNNQITIKIADGRYLGMKADKIYGWKAAAVKSPFLWNTYSESHGVTKGRHKYSLRPASNTELILRATTTLYNLGDPITVQQGLGGYGRSEVVFWELSGDEIPKKTA